MHGRCYDYIVTSLVKDGLTYPTGQNHTGELISQHLDFVPFEYDIQPKFNKILEIGALDVNGNLRHYSFTRDRTGYTGADFLDLISDTRDYTTIDKYAGIGVDIVMNAHELKFDDNTFDLVLSVNMLEHDSDPGQTLKEIYRVLAPGGLLVMQCANWLHPEHNDFGRGKEDYTFITKEMMTECLDGSGLQYSFQTVESDFLIRATKVEYI